MLKRFGVAAIRVLSLDGADHLLTNKNRLLIKGDVIEHGQIDILKFRQAELKTARCHI
jgi:hypothetical protein